MGEEELDVPPSELIRSYMNMMAMEQDDSVGEGLSPQKQNFFENGTIPLEVQMMKAFGVDSPQEAMMMMHAMGLQPEDLPKLLEARQQQEEKAKEPVQLTRRQQLGIDPIPPEVLAQIEAQQQAEARKQMEQEMILASGAMNGYDQTPDAEALMRE